MASFDIYTWKRRSLFPLSTHIYRFHLYLMALLLSLLALPVDSRPPSQSDAARIKKLEDSLLSPCCYGEPVSRHMSEIAFKIRKEIEEKVRVGRSDREILDYYKQLYGERILLEPEGAKRTALYSVPILLSLAGLALVVFFLWHSLRRPNTSSRTGATKSFVDPRIAEIIRSATDT